MVLPSFQLVPPIVWRIPIDWRVVFARATVVAVAAFVVDVGLPDASIFVVLISKGVAIWKPPLCVVGWKFVRYDPFRPAW